MDDTYQTGVKPSSTQTIGLAVISSYAVIIRFGVCFDREQQQQQHIKKRLSHNMLYTHNDGSHHQALFNKTLSASSNRPGKKLAH
jgi:hypothetical protein